MSFAMLVACSDRAPLGPQSPALVHPAGAAFAASPSRPFRGGCDTRLTVLPPLPGDLPNVLRLHIEYDCQLTHLGKSTAVAEQVVTFTGPTTAIASNTTVYTAANGDQLFATWSGTSTTVGADVTFSGPETYTGGTGRFAGASGSSWIAGTASFVTNTGQFTSVGTLAY
jgi:hypothetical protein